MDDARLLRYSRHILLAGCAGSLSQAHALIVGMGGPGAPAGRELSTLRDLALKLVPFQAD